MSEIAKKSIQTFVTRLAIQAVAIGGSVAIARVLGVQGKGVFTYATTALALLVVFNGQPYAISWQYTKGHRSPAALFRTMLTVLAGICIPAVCALVAAGMMLPQQRTLLYVAAALPFALFAQSATGFFLADSDVRTINRQQIISAIGPVLVYVPLLLVLRVDVGTVLAVSVLGYIVTAGYSFVLLIPYAKRTEGNDAAPLVREQLHYAWQIGLGNALMYLNSRIDVFLIMFILGQSALGIYSIGIAIGEMLYQLTRPIVTASFGRIARGTYAEAAAATATCMRHSLALTLTAGTIAFVLTPVLVPLVYGKPFAGAVVVTQILLPGIVGYSMMGALSTFFTQQMGEPRVPMLLRLLSAVICGVVTVILLPRVGITGGAIATTVSYLATFALAVAYFCKKTGIRPRKMFLFSRDDLHPYRALVSSALRFTV